MKTEKKPNEPSCCPPTTVVKDEADADPVKIKDEGTGGNNDDTTGEDTAECPRDTCLDPSNGEGSMAVENQSSNGNQSILNSIKQEADPNNPTDELPGTTSIYFCNFIICESLFAPMYVFSSFARVPYVRLIKLFFLL